MKTILSILLGLCMIHPTFAEPINFDDVKPGDLPPGWLSGNTGTGTPKWAVTADESAPSKPNVLKQSGEGIYLWCVKKDVSLTDGFVEVRFKPVSGKEDQAGGLVWRWKDNNNFYVARANALEDNVTIYNTIDGARRSFKNVEMKVALNEWHTLRVDFKAKHFRVTFDGKIVLDAVDEAIHGPGAVGVWTKADSVTLFDDFNFGSK